MIQKKLMISSLQHRKYSVHNFLEIIGVLPGMLDEVCIDFKAEPAKYMDPEFGSLEGEFGRKWGDLDEMLMNRHRNKMLKRLLFRCTRPHDWYNISELSSDLSTPADRTILGRIGTLLPRSMAAPNSFIEIDFDTKFFEPRF